MYGLIPTYNPGRTEKRDISFPFTVYFIEPPMRLVMSVVFIITEFFPFCLNDIVLSSFPEIS